MYKPQDLVELPNGERIRFEKIQILYKAIASIRNTVSDENLLPTLLDLKQASFPDLPARTLHAAIVYILDDNAAIDHLKAEKAEAQLSATQTALIELSALYDAELQEELQEELAHADKTIAALQAELQALQCADGNVHALSHRHQLESNTYTPTFIERQPIDEQWRVSLATWYESLAMSKSRLG